MKPTTYTIPVKFDIWDTQYAVTDHMIIKCPCRKYERGNSQSWGLTAKNNGMAFTVAEAIFGIPTAYGWTPRLETTTTRKL